jgi:osmotically-inducible protein OsmY
LHIHTLQEEQMKLRKLLGIFAPLILVVGCAQSDAGITTSVKSKLVADDLVKARQINVDTKDHVVTLTGTVQSTEEENQALQIARNTKGVSNVVDNIAVQGSEQNAAPTTGTEPAPMSGGTSSETTAAPATSSGSAPVNSGTEVPAVPPSGMIGDRPIPDSMNPMSGASSSSTPASASNAGDSNVNTQVKSALMADRSFNGQAITVDAKGGVVTLTGSVSTSADKTKAADIAGKVAGVTRVDNQITVSGK